MGPELGAVYIIVMWNNGFINVISELGYGRIFRIHMPRTE